MTVGVKIFPFFLSVYIKKKKTQTKHFSVHCAQKFCLQKEFSEPTSRLNIDRKTVLLHNTKTYSQVPRASGDNLVAPVGLCAIDPRVAFSLWHSPSSSTFSTTLTRKINYHFFDAVVFYVLVRKFKRISNLSSSVSFYCSLFLRCDN